MPKFVRFVVTVKDTDEWDNKKRKQVMIYSLLIFKYATVIASLAYIGYLIQLETLY